MKLYTVTSLAKEVLYSTVSTSNMRAFLEEWKLRRPNQLLLIHALESKRFSAIENFLDREIDDEVLLVFKVMITPTTESVVVDGDSLDVITKAAQHLEVISSDCTEYETLFIAPPDMDKRDLLKQAKKRYTTLRKHLTCGCDEDDCDDCEEEE